MRTLRTVSALVAVLLSLSCSPEAGPTDPSGSHLLGSGTERLGEVAQTTQDLLLSCRVLPYAATTKEIGSAGGTITVGPHTLVIPRGALSRTTRITAELPADPVSSVRFSPEGLQFAKPAALTLSYAHCDGAASLLPKRVAYTTELLTILEYLKSQDDLRNKRTTGWLDHFSRYAVAW